MLSLCRTCEGSRIVELSAEGNGPIPVPRGQVLSPGRMGEVRLVARYNCAAPVGPKHRRNPVRILTHTGLPADHRLHRADHDEGR